MDCNVYKPCGWIRKRWSISSTTLRTWHEKGKLRMLQYPTGKRVFDITQLEQILGASATDGQVFNPKKKIIYARVSSAKQKDDLERQIADLQSAYPNHKLVKDIDSGLNFKRPGLRKVLDEAVARDIDEVVVLHRDRLARFGVDLLEFLFHKLGVKLVVHNQQDVAETAVTSDEQRTTELAEDLLAITTIFVASHHGRRSASNKRKRQQQQQADQDGSDGDGDGDE